MEEYNSSIDLRFITNEFIKTTIIDSKKLDSKMLKDILMQNIYLKRIREEPFVFLTLKENSIANATAECFEDIIIVYVTNDGNYGYEKNDISNKHQIINLSLQQAAAKFVEK